MSQRLQSVSSRRQRPRAHDLRHRRRLQQRHRPLSLSLSLCTLLRALSSSCTNKENDNNSYYKFALSHIYTNMTFQLFTNIAPMDSQKHIYEYVPSSGGHSPSGLHYPALARHTSSGSHRVYRCRVLHIQFRPRPSLLISTVLLTSHPEGPVS